ncbi:uncharacterized protein LOC128874634 [Hylaeus volcanicus]|uniref:uncharacterized protein LOC128874634 n=1 Tax=Hylaeus volcanicus TaxID=313075 RepID=UPI0023B7DD94|nr:uncharacterized protein LOC128874634 [Hylaeus volcanicus]
MATVSADPACCLTDSRSKVSPPSDEPATTPLSDSDVNTIVERKLRTKNFRVLRWSLDSLGETNGFLGSYYTLSVTVRTDDKSKDFKFFVKTPPPSYSPQYEFLVRSNTFNKEIIIYDEMIPKLGTGIGPKWVPEFFLGRNNEVMVMEDVTQEGYVNPDKYVPFDDDHCMWLTRAMSALHSRSLIFDEKLRRSTGKTIMDLYGKLFEESAFIETEIRARTYLYACNLGAKALVDLVEGFTDEEKTTVKNRLDRWIVKIPKLMEHPSKYRHVLVHRDVWANNIMIKRDSKGKAIGCHLVDFQFMRYSPPAVDFVYSLYLTTNRATRRRCYDSLIELYLDTMRKELAAEGLDIDECFPRSQFIESCKEVTPSAIVYTVANLQIMLLSKEAVDRYFVGKSDELEDVMYGDKRPELVLSHCHMDTYRTRVLEVIEEVKDHLPDYPNC